MASGAGRWRTVQVSIDPAATDSMRPLTTPTSVEVREGPAQEPRAVRVGNQWQEVSSIEDRWSFDLWWRPTPMHRSYYRVSQADGQRLTIYRDQEAISGGIGRRREGTPGTGKMSYIELHAKSFHSFGLGASHGHELLAQARAFGMPALGLTDTNLCGALEFARLANSLEIQPITGGRVGAAG